MKRPLLRAFFLAACLASAAFFASPAAAAPDRRVLAVEFANDVNPVTQEFLTDEIERANREGFDAVVILLDTPGGLADSMREITKAELDSDVPVIVYVSPDGARAASAGVWIGQAADVLAMAPQTNIGSSTPINIGGEDIQRDLRRKAVNDAAASLRVLARQHGRNVRWADAAVRQASNLGADEALERNVIDVVAPTLPALLAKIDGRKTKPKSIVLRTAGARVEHVEMSLWKRILDTLVDPNIIVLLMTLGALGLAVELWHPGLIFPGTAGAVSLIVGLFGLQVLPVSWAGLLLVLLGLALFAAEPFVVSHGALALAGAVSFAVGSLILFDPAGEHYQVSKWLAFGTAATLGLFTAALVAKVVQVRRRPVAVGVERLAGERGRVRGDGYVAVNGELWRARTQDGAELRPGDEVEVERVEHGLLLTVRPVGGEPASASSEPQSRTGAGR